MVVNLIGLFRFIFIALFVKYIPGLSALQWTLPNSGSSGSVLYRCRHSNVTLSWSYVTNDNESVLATFWYSKRNGTLAHRFTNRFTTMSERLTYDDDVGLTLSELTSKDSGTYGMGVMLADWQSFESQQIELVVVEPPIVDGNGLIVLAQSADSSQTSGNGSCQSALQLKCGKIVDIGRPPALVVWTTPESGHMASSGYQDGYFVLDLAPHPKAGNYSCTLTPQPETLACVEPWTSGSDSATLPSTMSASLLVETAETRVEELAVTVGRLQDKLRLLETDHLATHIDVFSLHKENITEALSSLYSSVENITAEVDTHGSKVELCLQSLSEFQTAVLSELQSLKATSNALRLDLEEERRASSQQKAVIAEQAKDMAGLKKDLASVLQRLAHFEEWSRDIEQSHKNLKSMTTLLGQETKEVEASLQQAVRDAESRLTAVDSDLRRATDTLMDSTTTRINHLSNITDIIDYRLTRVSTDVKEIKANQSESLLLKVTALEYNVTAAHNQSQDWIPRLTAFKTAMEAALVNVSSRAVDTQTAVENLRLSVTATNRSLKATTSRIDQLTNGSLAFENRLTELSADLNELRLGADLRANQSESLSQEVTALHNTVTAAQTQNGNLIPRLASLEAGVAAALRNVSSLALDSQGALESLRLSVTVTNRSLESATSRLNQLTNASIRFEAAAAQLNTKYDKVTQTVLTITNKPQMTYQQLTSMQSTVSANKNGLSALVPRVTSLETAVQIIARLNNPVRLVGGNSSREGRVEIRVGYEWGTICDDNWDDTDAAVVCNMLGFHKSGARARPEAPLAYGQGPGPILLDEVGCAGTEYDIRLCPSAPQHNCGHHEDAGVVCAG